MACFETYKRSEAKVKGSTIFVFHTGKKEIYKPETLSRPSSRYLMLIMNGVTEAVSPLLVNRILGSFGNILQVSFILISIGMASILLETTHSFSLENFIKFIRSTSFKPIHPQSMLRWKTLGMPLKLRRN